MKEDAFETEAIAALATNEPGTLPGKDLQELFSSIELKTPKDAKQLLSRLIKLVLVGKLDPAIAKTVKELVLAQVAVMKKDPQQKREQPLTAEETLPDAPTEEDVALAARAGYTPDGSKIPPPPKPKVVLVDGEAQRLKNLKDAEGRKNPYFYPGPQEPKKE